MCAWSPKVALLLAFSLAACSTDSGPAAPLDGGVMGTAAQQHCLDKLNEYRAANGAGALILDRKLNDFAAAGSEELAAGGDAHSHFNTAKNNSMIFTDASGFCRAAGENQAPGWMGSSDNQIIDDVLLEMMNEGPGGGHHDNIINKTYTRVGVGLVTKNGGLYFTNDFSGTCP